MIFFIFKQIKNTILEFGIFRTLKKLRNTKIDKY